VWETGLADQQASDDGATLSDDGYWSDFFSPLDAIAAGGPTRLAIQLLNGFSLTQAWRVRWARWEQLNEVGPADYSSG
jgi:hypothetical protein